MPLTLVGGVVVALALQVSCAVIALRQRHVPAYVAILGPLVAIVAARHGFADFHPSMSFAEIVEEVRRAAWVGPVLVVMGLISFGAGVGARRGGKGAPALAQIGAMTVALGLVWFPAFEAQAVLWSAADGGDVAAAHVLARDLVWPWGIAAIAAFALLWTPVSLWGYWRDRRAGLGEGLAAAVLVALTLSTGRPAGRAVASVYAPARDLCAVLRAADVTAPPGNVTPVYGVLARKGAAGLERFVEGSWEPWVPTGTPRVLWVPAPGQPYAALTPDLAALPWGSEVLVAGVAEAPPATGPWLFQRHPVVVSAGCRAHHWPPSSLRAGEASRATATAPSVSR